MLSPWNATGRRPGCGTSLCVTIAAGSAWNAGVNKNPLFGTRQCLETERQRVRMGMELGMEVAWWHGMGVEVGMGLMRKMA